MRTPWCGGAPTFSDLGLEAQRMPDTEWLFTLLNGLQPAAMRSTEHVLRVIRLHLERYARQGRGARR